VVSCAPVAGLSHDFTVRDVTMFSPCQSAFTLSPVSAVPAARV